MKNLTTPRTLAECEFATGYPAIPSVRRERWAGALAFVTVFGASIAFGVLLAVGLSR